MDNFILGLIKQYLNRLQNFTVYCFISSLEIILERFGTVPLNCLFIYFLAKTFHKM